MMPHIELPRVEPELLESLKDLVVNGRVVEMIVGLYDFFEDHDKVAAWLNSENLNFGGLSPLELMLLGRGAKVREFVYSGLTEGGELP